MKASRRQFVKTVGYVSVGFSFFGTVLACADTGEGAKDKKGSLPAPVSDAKQIDSWLQVFEDGRVKILTGRMELGQGVRIAMMQVAAEELNTDLDLIEVNLAETDITPNEGYTAGSRSMESGAMSVRFAAASAREKMFELVSDKWEVSPDSLTIENGKISSGDKTISFYTLFDGNEIETKVKEPKEFKGKTIRKWVGKPIPRKDIAQMVQGNPVYVQDLRFPNMVHARIVRPETYSSQLNSFDESEIKKLPGYLKIVKLGSFIGLVAEEEYQAVRLKETAKAYAKWDSPDELPTAVSLREHIENIKADVETEENVGDWQADFDSAATTHQAEYYKPYIMHAANGPSCAVALYKDGKMRVWSHTQGVYPLRATLANLLGMSEGDVHVKGVPGSGCYGHNGADDVAAEAALIAKNFPERHVRLQWMREDEHQWEPYGSAMLMKLKAGLDSSGKITSWKYDFWSDGHSTRPSGDPINLLPFRFLKAGNEVPGLGYKGGAVRNSKPYYSFPNLNTVSHMFRGPLRKSALRGLGAYANVFAIESFMDEVAHKAGKDPIQFKIDHLDDPRAIEVLNQLRDKTKNLSTGDNEGIGYSFSRYKNQASYCAIAAHVRVDRSDGQTYVNKMWAVIEAGECINLDGLKNQTEGGMIQSASWALLEEVKFDKMHITSIDWDTYPVFRFPDIPQIEVEVIDRPEKSPLGAGEAAQGPATAAIVNAIFNATGVRARELPVKKALLINA